MHLGYRVVNKQQQNGGRIGIAEDNICVFSMESLYSGEGHTPLNKLSIGNTQILSSAIAILTPHVTTF